MEATAGLTEVVLYDTLVNYLVSMARTVEGAMNRALHAIVSLENPRTTVLPGEKLLQHMTQEPKLVGPGMQFILATRHLERIADHATNIAEDIIFWVRGLDVRHGRGLAVRPAQSDQTDSAPAPDSAITENSHVLHSGVTPACDTERA